MNENVRDILKFTMLVWLLCDGRPANWSPSTDGSLGSPSGSQSSNTSASWLTWLKPSWPPGGSQRTVCARPARGRRSAKQGGRRFPHRRLSPMCPVVRCCEPGPVAACAAAGKPATTQGRQKAMNKMTHDGYQSLPLPLVFCCGPCMSCWSLAGESWLRTWSSFWSGMARSGSTCSAGCWSCWPPTF